MVNNFQREKRKNKNFIINNSALLKQYAINNKKNFGVGIIIINLLLVENNTLSEEDLADSSISINDNKNNPSLQKSISYIPLNNFWFKIIRLKIKKIYNIDIKSDYDLEKKILIIFLKDVSLEKFSIYSVKL